MKILGMGNALVDISALMKSDDLLTELSLPKGSMTLIDKDKRACIFEKIENLEKEMTTGGSASNTSKALARMGMPAGFIGKVGSDKYGAFYIDEITKTGIIPHFITENVPSGTAMALISPNGERTFGTYLGAAANLIPEELDADIFKSYDYFYIEGYLVQNYALIEQAVKMAKLHGLKIAIDLASYNVVEANREFLERIIVEYVDIVFANEEEAHALTGKSPEEAVMQI
ncbi:MAG: adenosine kinase, partial [Dysgonamonadaceae bacterium]|nr:adenosine kinase [Dysgonamonadaceae bacterium]